MKDLTLMIPFRYDCPERAENLAIVTRRFHDLGATVLVGSDGLPTNSVDAPFHKTRILNGLLAQVRTPLAAMYDCDVLFWENQFEAALETLRRGGADVAYPYDGRFYDVSRSAAKRLQHAASQYIEPSEYKLLNDQSYGGCFVARTRAYREGGGENEFMISWGPEDHERHVRFEKLGYRIHRVPGPCYHMTHPRGPDSGPTNPFYDGNQRVFEQVRSMTADELRETVPRWPWINFLGALD